MVSAVYRLLEFWRQSTLSPFQLQIDTARIARLLDGPDEKVYEGRNVKTSRRSAHVFADCHRRLDVGTPSNHAVTRLGLSLGGLRHPSMSGDDLRRVGGSISSDTSPRQAAAPLLPDEHCPSPVDQPIGYKSKHHSRHGEAGQQSRAPGHHLLPQRRWPRHRGVPLPSVYDRCRACGCFARNHGRAEERRQGPDWCHRERVRKPRCRRRCRYVAFKKNRRQHRCWHLQRKREDADPYAQSNPQGNTAPVEHPQARMLPEIVTQPSKSARLFEGLCSRQPTPKPLLEFNHISPSIDQWRRAHLGLVAGARILPARQGEP